MKAGREGKKARGGKGWNGRGREMEGPTYKGRAVKGGEGKQGEGGHPGYYGPPPGSRGARIVVVHGIPFCHYKKIAISILCLQSSGLLPSYPLRLYNSLTDSKNSLSMLDLNRGNMYATLLMHRQHW